jgi:hypothetical protein
LREPILCCRYFTCGSRGGDGGDSAGENRANSCHTLAIGIAANSHNNLTEYELDLELLAIGQWQSDPVFGNPSSLKSTRLRLFASSNSFLNDITS